MLKTIALITTLATPLAAWAATCETENSKLSPERMAEIAALM